MSWRDEFFFYKGFNCRIEHEYEEDNIKAWHYAVDRNGKEFFADITPYDSSPETLRLWIDAGMPKRISSGPLHREDLEKVIYERA
ncbi:MAG: hypothetical protein ACKOPU_05650 [Candidatus Planktophila sp.]